MIRRVLAVASLVGLLAPALVHADSPAASLDRWRGVFHFAGGERERAHVESAIERATASMGPVARHIARSRLEREMEPDPRLTVTVEGKAVGIGPLGNWRTELDGPARTFEEDGDRYRVRHRTQGDRIVQLVENDSVSIRKTYALSEDGDRLRVEVVFTHDRLPAPLRFALSYRRASG